MDVHENGTSFLIDIVVYIDIIVLADASKLIKMN